MLDETLAQLEATIRQSEAIQAEKKTELLQLLTTLQAEVTALAQTHAAHAESVVRLTERSTQEAIRQPSNPQRVTMATQGLSAAVAELEASHPQLVQIVNAISVLLSSLGI
jgi:hypothetical protein